MGIYSRAHETRYTLERTYRYLDIIEQAENMCSASRVVTFSLLERDSHGRLALASAIRRRDTLALFMGNHRFADRSLSSAYVIIDD